MCVGEGERVRGVNFTKEIPLNKISENFQNVLKKMRCGGGVNLTKEISLKEISENPIKKRGVAHTLSGEGVCPRETLLCNQLGGVC